LPFFLRFSVGKTRPILVVVGLGCFVDQKSRGEPSRARAYTHDGRGLRTSKAPLNAQGNPITTSRVRYVYGPDGLLHGETAPSGTALATLYIWLNGEPVGLIRDNVLYYVHTDHLGRPEVVTKLDRTIAWRAENLAWDRRVVTDTIGGYQLGLPGQYFDGEAEQWYNWFRTYDGSTGRYTQADPIGLDGGMNLYLYANANPTKWVDADGLEPFEFSHVVGVTGVFHSGNAGASVSLGIGWDRSRRICVQKVVCGRVGAGQLGAVGLYSTASNRNFCEGQAATGGVFADGLVASGGGGAFDVGSASSGVSTTGRLLKGGGWAVGSQVCATETTCF